MSQKDSVNWKDIYDILGRLEDKIDGNFKQLKAENTKDFDDIEKRLGIVESFQTKAVAIVGVFSGIFTLVMTWIWDKVIGNRN